MEFELEKKWLLKRPLLDIKQLQEAPFQRIKSEMFLQSYMSPTERLRKIHVDFSLRNPEQKGGVIYEHFFKTPYKDGGSIEELSIITLKEYNKHKERINRYLKKTRDTFFDHSTGLRYELDTILYSSVPSINLLEIEFQDRYKTHQEINDNFTLPDFLQEYVVMDVTPFKEFSNYNLAQII